MYAQGWITTAPQWLEPNLSWAIGQSAYSSARVLELLRESYLCDCRPLHAWRDRELVTGGALMPIREVKKPDVTIMIKKAGKRDPDAVWRDEIWKTRSHPVHSLRRAHHHRDSLHPQPGDTDRVHLEHLHSAVLVYVRGCQAVVRRPRLTCHPTATVLLLLG